MFGQDFFGQFFLPCDAVQKLQAEQIKALKADKLADLIGLHYGLRAAEIDFIKNFELEIRMSSLDDGDS